MDTPAPRRVDTVLLFAAIVIGAFLAVPISFVGLPLAAAGVAGLVYRGRTVIASIACAVGAVTSAGVAGLGYSVFLVSALAAVYLTVVLLPRRSFQVLGAGLVAVVSLASLATDALMARLQGTTLIAVVAKESAASVEVLKKIAGNQASADTLRAIEESTKLIAAAWPSAYFQSAMYVGILVIAAAAWAARRSGTSLPVPKLGQLDLSPHVLWPFVGGVLMLASSYGSFSGSHAVYVVGLNLVLCVRTLFFLQGISVAAGMLDRAGVGLGGRILALAALAALDVPTFAVSFTGLLDFWVNIRRLPREGAAPVVTDPDAGRRW